MVDDDDHDLFLTEIAFKRSAHNVKFTALSSGEDLISFIKYNGIGQIDILLLDFNMPKMDGIDVLKVINKLPGFETVGVYMFSTSRRAGDRTACLKEKARDYFVKPSNMADMQAMIDHLVKDD